MKSEFGQPKNKKRNPRADLQNGLVGSSCSPRESQESSPTPQFKSINSLALILLHSPTLTSVHDHWKNHSYLQTRILINQPLVKEHAELCSRKANYKKILFFFNFYFILLYNTVLVLPYIDMNPPRVYMHS